MMKYKLKNNRGAALLSVIVAMTVVAVIGMLILALSYTNFNMKITERKSKNNFYTAESVLDDIIADLESQMSTQYIEAYSTVMANYGYYETQETSEGTDLQTAMLNAFRQEFVVDMATYLAVDASDLTKYDITKLGRRENVTTDADGNPVTTVSSVYDGKYPDKDQLIISSTGNTMQTFEEKDDSGNVTAVGLLIKNVQVYYEENGYANTINTDIKITAPSVTFARVTSMTDISQYAYIAQGGVDVSGNITLDLNGNAFSGLVTAVSTGATLDATGSSLLISKDETVLSGGATFTTGSATTLWTAGLKEKKSDGAASTDPANNSLVLAGRTFVKDDATLSGTGNKLTLSGEYYGFSASSTTASESSAIVVNGKNTTLDLSGLKTLVLAGSAFVSTTNAANTATTEGAANKDVLTGESIAVKGNQIAYLVPTDVYSASGIPANPMTKVQYTALQGKTGTDGKNWDETALTTKIASLGKSIRNYDSEASIVAEYVTGAYTSDQVVYLYIKFSSSAKAREYFMDLYTKDAETRKRLQNYLDTYVYSYDFMNGISGSYTLLSNGNYLVEGVGVDRDSDGTVDDYQAKYEASTANNVTAVQALSNYQSSYENLCNTLATTTSGSADTSTTVYEKVVRKDVVTALTSAIKVSNTDGSIYTVIVNGDYTFTSDLSGKGGIIIASGNVTVSGNYTWDGIIICGGKLKVTGSAVLNADAANVEAAKSLATGDSTYVYAGNFFKGGESYAPAAADSTETVVTGSTQEDIRSCLTLENYVSE